MREFFEMARFPGVTACIDCTHVRINSPGGDDAEVYRNRKGVFSINVQASAACRPRRAGSGSTPKDPLTASSWRQPEALGKLRVDRAVFRELRRRLKIKERAQSGSLSVCREPTTAYDQRSGKPGNRAREAGGQDQRSPARDPRQAVRRVNSWTSVVKFVPDRAIGASDRDDRWKSCSSTDPTRTCKSCVRRMSASPGRVGFHPEGPVDGVVVAATRSTWETARCSEPAPVCLRPLARATLRSCQPRAVANLTNACDDPRPIIGQWTPRAVHGF
ncbi:hypothetical protein HPB47_014053 [Ixodes persulcatus]|uniref:Uncharacterized protein n=1 Tax=Ixodes persulcatus TaxID=34615 RepID=A0AC60QWW2_IXOPE|nr:hypothetical protein HPB47_014053 [Ixodes persulcatus]